MSTTPPGPTTTVYLNGRFWGSVIKPLILMAAGAGGAGLIVSIQQCGVVDGNAARITDHETRIRVIEAEIGQINAGVLVLLERTGGVPPAGSKPPKKLW